MQRSRRAPVEKKRPPTLATSPAAKIHAIVRKIPRGSVATYGEVAALAGIESGHRVAAQAMRVCPESLPWQRVIGKQDARRGKVVIDDSEHGGVQRALLEAEGVTFDDNGFIPLRSYGWLWQTDAPALAAKKKAKASKRAKTTAKSPRARKRILF